MPGPVPRFIYRQLVWTPAPQTTDCTGRTFIVTGANVGLGMEAVRHYVSLGASKVIIACRSVEKGEAARRDIENTTKRTGVIEVWALDLEDYASVKRFAKRMETLPRIDALVESAGVANTVYSTAGGNESTITVNVVSTFLLALLALPHLRATGKANGITPTVSIVTSEVHEMVPLPEADGPGSMFDVLNDEKTAKMDARYPTSKLLEVLAVREITREHSVDQLGVTINLVNPGFCHSLLARNMDSLMISIMKSFLARTTAVGARTLVHGGLQGPESHGLYHCDCRVLPVGGVANNKDTPRVQKKVWTELGAKLEKIQPGVLKGLDG